METIVKSSPVRFSIRKGSHTTKKHYRLWSVVRGIIRKNHATYKDEYLRDVFYLIGDVLGAMIGQEISQEDYDWFNTRQGYATLRDDVWTDIEQKHGWIRPKAWTFGVVYDNNIAHSLETLKEKMDMGLTYLWDQARGFIFVEKGGVAKKLKPLSEFGWTIFAGKGYPERLLRKLLKEEKQQRPVLVLHDWDPDGKGIFNAMETETRRTKHLNLALRERVSDLGLTQDDIEKLKLPTRPSPPKYQGKPRVEISGLAVLKTRMGIPNPALAYTVAKMLSMDLTLSPNELSKLVLLKKHLRYVLTDGLESVVREVIDEFADQLEDDEAVIIEGTAVEGVLQSVEIIDRNVKAALLQTAKNLANNLLWTGADEMHNKAIAELTDDRLLKLLKE